ISPPPQPLANPVSTPLSSPPSDHPASANPVSTPLSSPPSGHPASANPVSTPLSSPPSGHPASANPVSTPLSSPPSDPSPCLPHCHFLIPFAFPILPLHPVTRRQLMLCPEFDYCLHFLSFTLSCLWNSTLLIHRPPLFSSSFSRASSLFLLPFSSPLCLLAPLSLMIQVTRRQLMLCPEFDYCLHFLHSELPLELN
ncbi:unnamed protein product, partial [Closterium sp. NIES-53]